MTALNLEKLKNDKNNLNYYEVTPENSSFYTIGCDITHRCNMECSNCYSPIRTLPDVNKEEFFNFIKKLKKKTEIRFTGGEPTLHKDLEEMIEKVIELGHRPAIMTNGLKLADINYAARLKDAGLKFVCMSLNGADENNIYLQMDGQNCAPLKMKALDNLIELGFFINLNCIIAKGVNEHIPLKIIDYLQSKSTHAVLRLRNIGQLGRFMENENYTFEQLINLISKQFNKSPDEIRKFRSVNGYEEEHNILFPIEKNKKLNTSWIKITDWRPSETSIPDPNSRRRGRMTKNFMVAPFFEHALINGY